MNVAGVGGSIARHGHEADESHDFGRFSSLVTCTFSQLLFVCFLERSDSRETAATDPQVGSRSGHTKIHLPVKHDLVAGTKRYGKWGFALSDACSLEKVRSREGYETLTHREYLLPSSVIGLGDQTREMIEGLGNPEGSRN